MRELRTQDGYDINEIQLYGGGALDVANVVLVRRRQRDNKCLWAVMDGGSCLSKEGKWVFEPTPSSRDDEFLALCRFGTPDEAIAVWRGLEHPTRFWHYGAISEA
jgi:hypothetical protein